jgi:hypothetical protein
MIIKPLDEDFMGNDIIKSCGQHLPHILLFITFLKGQLGINVPQNCDFPKLNHERRSHTLK